MTDLVMKKDEVKKETVKPAETEVKKSE